MKRNKGFMFVICGLAIVFFGFSIFSKPKQPQQQTTQEESVITAETAEAEISFIKITPDETEFLQQILKSEEVLKALESSKNVTLTAENATKLAQEYLQKDVTISEFSVQNKNVYVDYFINEYRLVYQVEQSGAIHKFVGVHDENKNATALYENVDNESFKKVVFNTITK